MKCRECKEQIMLWDVLSPAEKEIVTEHLKNCKDCQVAMAEMQQYSEMIKASNIKPIINNPEGLVDVIMDRVVEEKRKSMLQHKPMFDFFDFKWVRYALAGSSLYLILFFMIEINKNSSNSIASNQNHNSDHGVILESSSLRKNFPKLKKSNFSMAICKTALGKIDVSCLRNKISSN